MHLLRFLRLMVTVTRTNPINNYICRASYQLIKLITVGTVTAAAWERWDKVQPTLRRIDERPCKRSLNSGPSRLSILRGLVLGVFDFWSRGGFIELSWNRGASLATNLPPRPISNMHAFRSSNLGLRLSASVTSPRDNHVQPWQHWTCSFDRSCSHSWHRQLGEYS